VVDTLLIDQETVYAPRQGNDRLLLGLKGSLNEYELDLLRQRSLAARYEKARRGELIVAAPVGFVKVGDRLEKDPDRRVQEAIRLAIDKVAELGSVRQALLWFLEHGLDLPTRVNAGRGAARATPRSARSGLWRCLRLRPQRCVGPVPRLGREGAAATQAA
jgi:DNA invertase Pin-like site-specific DNA recombinase